jgi:2-polyprenyl-3-methyl-5-hydroxy-6-metoxy-1,4-benzoquinol methylase
MTAPAAPPHPPDAGIKLADCAWCNRPIEATAEYLTGRVRCRYCGVANTYPWPTDEELDAAYSTWYRPSAGRFSGFGDAVLRRTRGLLARRLDRIAPAGNVLDVGAGDGSLLDALQARGRGALGLERHATRRDMREGDLSDVGGPWSAIVFWHSLEHLRNPGEEVERAAGLLVPTGVLVIAVPNADSLQARLFGDNWLALDLPRHLVHLPAKALIQRIEALPLRVERVSYWRGGQVLFGWVHGLVAELPGHPDLYDAIRRPEARRLQHSAWPRAATIAAGVLLAPFAVLAAIVEVAVGLGGTVYIEARCA